MTRLKRLKDKLKKKENRIARRIIAMTDNIKEVPANTSIAVFQSEYDKLKKEGYEIFDINGTNNGVVGEFAYRPAGSGVEYPIIYLRELYVMTKKGGYIVNFVVEHKYDTNGNIIASSYRKYEDEKWIYIKNDLLNGQIPSIIDNGMLYELPNVKTYSDAKNEVDNIVNTKQKISND